MTLETLIEVNAEALHQEQDEKEIKNRIMRIGSSTKKMEAQKRNFVADAAPDDSYLLGKIF